MNDFPKFWGALRLNIRKFVLVLIGLFLVKWFCQFMEAPVLLDLNVAQPDLNGSATTVLQYILLYKVWLITLSVMTVARSMVEKPHPA